jgi:hypothetical protein
LSSFSLNVTNEGNLSREGFDGGKELVESLPGIPGGNRQTVYLLPALWRPAVRNPQ